MPAIHTHASKPSYLGDPTDFAFPAANSSLVESSPKKIERVGSILIKSGIPRVSPFPESEPEKTLDDLVDTRYSNGSTLSSDETRNNTTNSDTTEGKIENSLNLNQVKQDDLVAKRPSLRPVASMRSTSKFVNPYLRNSLLRKYKEEKFESENVERLNEESENETVRERNESLSTTVRDRENLKKLNSLRSIHSQRSIRRGDSIHSMDTVRIIPAKSMKRYQVQGVEGLNQDESPTNLKSMVRRESGEQRFGKSGVFDNIPENQIINCLTQQRRSLSLTSRPNIEELEIPRRSSKRLLTKPSLGRSASRIGRSLSISSRKSKLNGDSMRTIQTLATEIRSGMHKSGFKSVDFTSLDLLLQELIDVKEDSNDVTSLRSSKSFSLRSLRRSSSRRSNGSRKISGQYSFDNGSMESLSRISSLRMKSINEKHLPEEDQSSMKSDVSEFEIVKPFTIRKSLSRRFSVKRDISMLSNEINKVHPTFAENMAKLQSRPQCELKRSNAIKRRPRIVEMLINLIESIKNAGKRVWIGITRSSKKVSFNKSKKGGARGVKIGKPVLVDIEDTAFVGHNIHKSDTKIRTIPIMEAKMKTHSATGSGLSTIQSEEFNADGVEKDQLVILWKHYLSNSIMNRVDMKMDAANATQLQRVKSIQSNKSKRKSIEKQERKEVDKMFGKYVMSETSSIASSTDGPIHLIGMSDNSSSEFNTEKIEETFDTVLFGDQGSIAPTYETFVKSRHTSFASSTWSTVHTENDSVSGSETSEGYSDNETDRSSISTIAEEDSSYGADENKDTSGSSGGQAEDNFSLINRNKSVDTNFKLSSLRHSPNMRDLHTQTSTMASYHSALPSRTSSMFSYQRSVY